MINNNPYDFSNTFEENHLVLIERNKVYNIFITRYHILKAFYFHDQTIPIGSINKKKITINKLLELCKSFSCYGLLWDKDIYKIIWEEDTPIKFIKYKYAIVIDNKDNESCFSLAHLTINKEGKFLLEHFQKLSFKREVIKSIDDDLINTIKRTKKEISYIFIRDKNGKYLDMKELD